MAPPKRNELERFFNFIEKSYPCWKWKGRKDKDGYGEFQLYGVKWKAHRAAFQLLIDDLKEGEWVLHSCDNPECTKPAHLRVGSAKDNHNDMNKRKRFKNGMKSNRAKLTGKEVEAIKRDPRKQIDIAKDYKISQSSVSRIKLNKVYVIA